MKRGQAAIEFLMTYGWALLIILVAISALVYFGVLNADKFLPERCDLPTGLSCLSFKLSEDDAVMVVQNNLGEDITLSQVAILLTRNTTKCSLNLSTNQGELINGDRNNFNLQDCGFGSVGKKFKGLVKLTYTDEEFIERVRTGEIVGTVEES